VKKAERISLENAIANIAREVRKLPDADIYLLCVAASQSKEARALICSLRSTPAGSAPVARAPRPRRAARAESPAPPQQPPRLEEPLVLAETPAYMAPEQPQQWAAPVSELEQLDAEDDAELEPVPVHMPGTPDARRELIVAFINGRGGVIRRADLPSASSKQTADDLTALSKAEEIFRAGFGRDGVIATRRELLPPVELVHLPMLERGHGEKRDDCGNYDGCLTRFAHAHPSAAARCPTGCASYDPEPSHVRLARAHAYGARTTPSAF
jgi:hypothetical protein